MKFATLKCLGATLMALALFVPSKLAFSATEYASSVTEVSGGISGSSTNVLGAPDTTFIQLGQDSSITLDFGTVSTATTLLQIYTLDDLFPAPASIEISTDNTNFVLVDSPVFDAQGSDPPPYPSADFIVGDFYRYVRIIDLGLSPSPYEDLGFDLDAIARTVVPLPAAAWLFGSALIGLVVVARRKAII